MFARLGLCRSAVDHCASPEIVREASPARVPQRAGSGYLHSEVRVKYGKTAKRQGFMRSVAGETVSAVEPDEDSQETSGLRSLARVSLGLKGACTGAGSAVAPTRLARFGVINLHRMAKDATKGDLCNDLLHGSSRCPDLAMIAAICSLLWWEVLAQEACDGQGVCAESAFESCGAGRASRIWSRP